MGLILIFWLLLYLFEIFHDKISKKKLSSEKGDKKIQRVPSKTVMETLPRVLGSGRVNRGVSKNCLASLRLSRQGPRDSRARARLISSLRFQQHKCCSSKLLLWLWPCPVTLAVLPSSPITHVLISLVKDVFNSDRYCAIMWHRPGNRQNNKSLILY